MTSRKEPGMAFWAPVMVVVVLVLYVVSCPIVFALGDLGVLPDRARRAADKVYWPIGRILDEIFGGNC